jgi:1-acyl-sn-glycerol-3-phosphate acyltransferase
MSHVLAEPDDSTDRADDSSRRRSERGDAFYWRLIATAMSFAVFGLGALALSVTILPLLRMLPAARSQRWSRLVLRRGMRAFIGVMHRTRLLTYDFRGAERLGKSGQLIVANHPSLIDVVFLIAFVPRANCVVKHAMFRNLLTRSVVSATGYISNELTADMIERAAAVLDQGQCLIMFPEGTRTSVGKPLEFHRGAANVAIRAAATVTPVYIRCEPVTLTKAQPWYRIPRRRPHFTLEVGEDFDLSAARGMKSIPLASRAFNEQMRGNFHSELQRLDGYTSEGCGATGGVEPAAIRSS